MKRKQRKRTNSNVPAKGRLRDICDRLWSLAVRADWNNRCAICGSRKCEAHHLVPRQHQATRYDLWNGIALCASCHQFSKDVSPHQNAAGFLVWLLYHFPTRYGWLMENHRPKFDGTVNVPYYLGEIWRLREYVSEEEFDSVCGVRFAAYLEELETRR